MSEWKPIHTAPKDGSWYVTCIMDDGLTSFEVGRYDPAFGEMYVPEGNTGLYRAKKYKIYDYRGFNNHHRATHWMPLPAPPKAID